MVPTYLVFDEDEGLRERERDVCGWEKEEEGELED